MGYIFILTYLVPRLGYRKRWRERCSYNT